MSSKISSMVNEKIKLLRLSRPVLILIELSRPDDRDLLDSLGPDYNLLFPNIHLWAAISKGVLLQ